MKVKKLGTLLMVVTMMAPLAVTIPANASTKRIPKTYRGTWISKPVYTYQMKHVRKNMAIPKLQLKVTSKMVKYQFKGYLPKDYDHKVHKLSIKKVNKHSVYLKGEGPFGSVNILAKLGKKLILAYDHGGDSRMTKVK